MLGSYYQVPQSFYRDIPAETPGWQNAPVPGWGINPLRAGPRRVGVGGCVGCIDEGFDEPDNSLPEYAAVGGCGPCGCGGGCSGIGEAEEDQYKETTWGHVALAAAGGIIAGMLFMYIYKG
jgi:hypothetical protein